MTNPFAALRRRVTRTEAMTRHHASLILLLLIAVLVGGSAQMRVASAQGVLDKFVYLPLVFRSDACALLDTEARIVESMRTHPEQKRASLTCDPILERVARERALDMAVRHYFGHVNPDGFAANYLVRQAGYPLPAGYGSNPDDNNIESIAAGYATPDAVWAEWMASAGHREHLLGLSPFFAEQIEYGIGYAYDPNSDDKHYWVVITAKREP